MRFLLHPSVHDDLFFQGGEGSFTELHRAGDMLKKYVPRKKKTKNIFLQRVVSAAARPLSVVPDSNHRHRKDDDDDEEDTVGSDYDDLLNELD